jgi:hypothetical protein
MVTLALWSRGGRNNEKYDHYTAVVSRLKRIFARHGHPGELTCGIGPPFSAADFDAFHNQNGIRHRKITPLWPQTSAEAERFMRTL